VTQSSAAHDDPYAVHWLDTADADPVEGRVRWDPMHSAWNGGMALAALLLGPLTFRWSALAVFAVLTAATLLLGHSVGLHRRLIHRSFDCPAWLEAILVWFCVLVGMDGPLSMVRIHDTRDWAQRQPRQNGYFGHRGSMSGDAWRQLHCRLDLRRPPRFAPDATINRPLYRWLERTWMLQQAPVAFALYLLGGWPWVVWGVPVRVFASVTGHWFVGHLAHRRGPQTWLVEGAGVQAHDVPWAAIPTMGEAWHNNHHAYPASARMGLHPGQIDPGFVLIQLLAMLGLAWSIRTPATLPPRPILAAVGAGGQ
jgi:stearoyl-CoA desaturase (delta-9 desaturase)